MTRMLCVALLAALVAGCHMRAQVSAAPHRPLRVGDFRRQMDFMTGIPQFYFNQAIAGADRRLEDPDCLRVFGEFRDGRGNTLAANLERTRQSATQFLSDLWWVDASGAPACDDPRRIAYTTPGSRTIFVCGDRFADPVYALHGRLGPVVVIHEMLHALGLGENPPASGEITRRVAHRCAEE